MTSPSKPQPKKVRILGHPSWPLRSDDVEAYVTETGGHLGPVTFDRRKRKIAPYAVAPWAEEKLGPDIPPMLKVLRGDFFCLPFGGNDRPFRGERHPPHGESANAPWKFEDLNVSENRSTLHLSLETTVRPSRIDKRISLVNGHNAVYSQHVVSGMSGPMNLGHHAMLKFPDEPGSGVISTSPFVHGQVFVEPTELPSNRGYSLLKPGAAFDSLERVPTITGEETDLSRYPARRGFEDIVMLVSDAAQPFAWTAVTFPRQRFVWFSLKDPTVLRQTVFWLSNGGRHYPPWNGRHVNVMGLEEVTSYFHYGLAESARPNPVAEKGYPTCLRLNPKQPLVVNTIMAVAPVPAGFDRVAGIEPQGGGVVLRAQSGKTVHVPLDVDFVHRSD